MSASAIASAGTTLVGQSIGAGARDWALRVGNRTILDILDAKVLGYSH